MHSSYIYKIPSFSLLVIFSLVLGGSTASSESTQTNCSTLYLLNVVSYPDDGGWDRGLDLVPAGHLATAQINNHSELLSGYKLKLIDIDSESCGTNTVTKGLVNLNKELMTPFFNNRSSCIVGIIGLYCSMETNALAPIVSHPASGVDYVKLAASTAPEHRYDPSFRDVYFIPLRHQVCSMKVSSR